MLVFFEAYLERLEIMHERIKGVTAGLPAEALDWQPGPETNSIAVLMVHIAGAERYWIGDVAGQEPSGRNRPAEFETTGLDAKTLNQRLDNSLAHARTILGPLSLADLAQPRQSVRHERSFSVAWALLHALEHTAVHSGHIELTRQLWEQAKTPE